MGYRVDPKTGEKRLSRVTLVAYGCGDLASNLCWTFIGSYLTVYYTDVVGIAPGIAAAIMLGARVWDGVNDPMFGAIAERTRTKQGRFRPYIFWGTPFLAVFTVLTFTNFLGTGDGVGPVLWATGTYIICGMLYTVVNLSYGSLSTVMTTNLDDIAQLNSWRMIGTNVSAVALSAITPPLLMMFSGGEQFTPEAYTEVAIIFAICSIPLFYFVWAMCKETIKPVDKPDGEKVSLIQSFKAVVTNGPLMIIFLIQLLVLCGVFGRIGTVLYYLMNNVSRFDLISLFMALPSLMTVLGIICTKNFVVRIGRKKMMIIGFAGSGIALIALYFIGWDNIPLIIICSAVYGFFSFSGPIPMAMVPDAINYMEDKTGVRADGTSYAVVSLSTKFGNAFGVALGLLIMGAFGYDGTAMVQTPEALEGINLTVNLLFGALFLLACIPAALFPLSEKRCNDINARLAAKRAAVEGVSVETADAEDKLRDEAELSVAEGRLGEAGYAVPDYLPDGQDIGSDLEGDFSEKDKE